MVNNYIRNINNFDNTVKDLERILAFADKSENSISNLIGIVDKSLDEIDNIYKHVESNKNKMQKPETKQDRNYKVLTNSLKNLEKDLNDLFDAIIAIDSFCVRTLVEQHDDLTRTQKADRFGALRGDVKETKHLEDSAIRMLAESNKMKLLNERYELNKGLEIKNINDSAKLCYKKIYALKQAQQPLEIKFDSDITKNPVFDGSYLVADRYCISSGSYGTTERLLLRREVEGELKSGYFICKTPLIPFSVSEEIIPKKAIKKMPADLKLSLFQLFGPGGVWNKSRLSAEDIKILKKFQLYGKDEIWKKTKLSESDIKTLRNGLFGHEYGGQQIIDNKTLVKLIEAKSTQGYAIKSLDQQAASLVTAENITDFFSMGMDGLINELNISCSLFQDGSENPHIAKSICGGTDSIDGVYIIQEYAPGTDLKDFVERNGPLTYDSFKNFSLQLLDGLAFIASKNVVHKDIKLDNIMISQDGNIKIIDLGEAICLDKLDSYPFATSGIANNWVPELRGGTNWKEVLSPKSDSFLAGMALLNAISTPEEEKECSDILYVNKIDTELLQKHIKNVLNSKFPQASDEEIEVIFKVLVGLLEVNPQERLSAEEAKNMLESLYSV